MNTARFNPVIGLLLALLAIVALVIALSANSNRKKPGEVALLTEPTTSPYPSPQPTSPAPIPSESPVTTPTSQATPASTPSVYTPPPIPNPNEQEERVEARIYQSLYTRPGVVIAEGTNITPTGRLNLLTYRLEEIELPGPTQFTPLTTGRFITVDKVWRLTITGGPFPIGAMPPLVYLDNKLAGKGTEVMPGIVTVLFDDSLLREGASIAVTYIPDYLTDFTLPEALHLSR